MLKKAIDRETKSESGFSFAMASQPFSVITDRQITQRGI